MEAMLLRWSETSSGGATITLQLADVDDLEQFKLMTLAKGKMAGQILDIAWSEVGLDERDPTEAIAEALAERGVKTRPLCLLAVQWCRLPKFQEWLSTAYPMMWEAMRDDGDAETVAKMQVLELCDISSRTELDTNADAAKRFHEKIRAPFKFVCEAIGEEHGDR
jgi:hypothetical protein